MQKILAFFLVICLIFSLAACGKTPEAPVQTNPTTEATEGTTQGTEPTVPTTVIPTVPEETTTPEQEQGTVAPEETDPPEVPTTPEVTEPTQEETTHPEKPEDAPVMDNGCTHDYRFTSAKAATCTADGYRRYTCNLCANVYRQVLPATGHTYISATCTAAKYCKVCKVTEGKALGHHYGADGLCTRCGEKDPNDKTGAATFTANIRSNKGDVIPGITVSLYVDASTTPVGTAVTDSKGVAKIPVSRQGDTYRIVLSNVPDKFKAEASYTFTSLTVSVNLSVQPVYDPLDHSGAMYKEGDTMVEFTLTDVDGKTYRLSELLTQKKLIVIDFWYVQCNPCKAEFPYFEKAQRDFGDDIIILTVNPYDSDASIKALRQEMGVTFPMLRDTLGLAKGFEVTQFPTTVFIDSSGTIRDIHRDAYSSLEAFFRAVDKYL